MALKIPMNWVPVSFFNQVAAEQAVEQANGKSNEKVAQLGIPEGFVLSGKNPLTTLVADTLRSGAALTQKAAQEVTNNFLTMVSALLVGQVFGKAVSLGMSKLPENIVSKIPFSLPNRENVLGLTVLFMLFKSALSPLIENLLPKEKGAIVQVYDPSRAPVSNSSSTSSPVQSSAPKFDPNSQENLKRLHQLKVKVLGFFVSGCAMAAVGKARGYSIDLVSAVAGAILYKTTEKIVTILGNQVKNTQALQERLLSL